jgi:hypothetical protein
LTRNRIATLQQTRSYSKKHGLASKDRGLQTNESRWQQRTFLLPEDRTDEFSKYPFITGEELRQRKTRPKKVKMYLRDFIEGKTCS